MAEEIVIAVAIDEIADFTVRLVNTETALQTIIFSTKEMLGDDDCLGKLLKEIAADATSVLSYPKLKPYAKKIAEATIERNDARNALDRVEEASKDIYLTPAQLKYDVGIRFKQQEAAFEIERGIWRKSEKEFKMAFDTMNARIEQIETESKWAYGKMNAQIYDVGIRFKQQEAAFEIERGIWRKSEKEFKLAYGKMNARIEQLETESKWAFGKVVFHPNRSHGVLPEKSTTDLMG